MAFKTPAGPECLCLKASSSFISITIENGKHVDIAYPLIHERVRTCANPHEYTAYKPHESQTIATNVTLRKTPVKGIITKGTTSRLRCRCDLIWIANIGVWHRDVRCSCRTKQLLVRFAHRYPGLKAHIGLKAQVCYKNLRTKAFKTVLDPHDYGTLLMIFASPTSSINYFPSCGRGSTTRYYRAVGRLSPNPRSGALRQHVRAVLRLTYRDT